LTFIIDAKGAEFEEEEEFLLLGFHSGIASKDSLVSDSIPAGIRLDSSVESVWIPVWNRLFYIEGEAADYGSRFF